MKKTDIALIIVVVLVIIVGIFAFGKNTEAKIEYELPLTLEGESGLSEITYKEYKEKMESEKPFIVIIERTTCSHCINYMPVAEQFASDYNIPMYYINTDNLSQDEFTSLQKSNTFFKKKKDNWGTPTTIILIGNQAIDYLEGETDEDGLNSFLSEYITLEKVSE